MSANKRLLTAGSSQSDRPTGPLSWFYARVFTDLREPEDQFEVILRKIVVSVGALLTIFPIAFAIYMVAEVASSGVAGGNLTTLLTMLLFPALWVPTFVFVRRSRKLTNRLMDVWLLGTTFGVGILAIAFVEYPIQQLAIFLSVLSLLCDTPKLWVHLVACLTVYIISMLNSAFSGLNQHPEATLLAMTDTYRGSLLERIAYQISGLAIGLIIGSALLMQTRERKRHERAAICAIDMARTVAEQLSIYDIDATKKTLGDASAEGIADPELVQHFALIADNLEAYRPHLPNWMLDAFHAHKGATAVAEEEEEGSISVDQEIDRDLESVTSKEAGARSSDAGSSHSPHRRGSMMSVRGGPPSSRSPKQGNLNRSPQAFGLNTRTYYTGRVTMVTVDYHLANVSKMTMQRREELMGQLVENVHAIAKDTQAALHTFIGDQIHVSWNTASRVSQCEVKACKFLMRVNALREQQPSLAVSGAAFSGDARVIFAGDKHQALCISYRWREAHRALTTFCAHNATFVVDGSTRSAAQTDVIARGVDAVLVNDWRHGGPQDGGHNSSFSASKATRVVNVFELVRATSVSEKENNDEWMYVLQKSSAVDDADKVLALCVEGDFAAALEAVDKEIEDCIIALQLRSRSCSVGAGGLVDAFVPYPLDVRVHRTPPAISPKGMDSQGCQPWPPTSPKVGAPGVMPTTLNRAAPLGDTAAELSDVGSIEGGDIGGASGTWGIYNPRTALRMLSRLRDKIERHLRENIPAVRFPEDFTSANWKQ
jgi:hypothetical protein